MNNSAEDALEVMHRAVEARLHQMQFERVYCKASHKRDDLYAYFIQRHQIAMGMIPDPKKVREERRALRQGNPGGTYSERSVSSGSESEISNFSLEIEMLNRMHVDKNNNQALAELPLVYEWQLPDPALPLYLEEAKENGKITFRPDMRHKIVFKDPVTKIHKK